MADERSVSVPPTVVKPKRAPAGYTGASGFIAVTGVLALVGSISLFSYASMASQAHAVPSQTPQPIPSVQPSAAAVAPTADPTPSPAFSARVTTTNRVMIVSSAPASVASQPVAPPVPSSAPTISPAEQYAAEERARTLASRRASSVVKFSQDDQARQDLADAGAVDRPAVARPEPPTEPQAIPVPSSTSLFASDADGFVRQRRNVAFIALLVSAGSAVVWTGQSIEKLWNQAAAQITSAAPIATKTAAQTPQPDPSASPLKLVFDPDSAGDREPVRSAPSPVAATPADPLGAGVGQLSGRCARG